jgi:hypothetical protein
MPGIHRHRASVAENESTAFAGDPDKFIAMPFRIGGIAGGQQRSRKSGIV